MRIAVAISLFCVLGGVFTREDMAQTIPLAANRPWHAKEERSLSTQLESNLQPTWKVDPVRIYTLSELIDLAELHNPETRSARLRVRRRADEVGIARATYFPTLVAAVYASSERQPALIGKFLHRQTSAVLQPTLHVDYLIFDVGGRSGEVDIAKANLLVQDMAFNDTHRHLIYQVASAYFRLLKAEGLRTAAEVSLQNAQTVEVDAESRLKSGLGTQPDLLEASAARIQADYDLQAAIGSEAIAHSEVATTLALPADTQFHVLAISDLPLPTNMADSLEQEIKRALTQRPELLAQVARIRAAEGESRKARSTHFPTLHLAGDAGLARGYAQQDLYPGRYAEGEIW